MPPPTGRRGGYGRIDPGWRDEGICGPLVADDAPHTGGRRVRRGQAPPSDGRGVPRSSRAPLRPKDGPPGSSTRPKAGPPGSSARPKAGPPGSSARANARPPGGRPFPELGPCQDDTAQPAQTPVSYLSKLMSNIKLMEVKQPSGCRLSSSTGSTILVHQPPDWYFRIYIRVDLSGRFHTYPHTGGPFQSLQETQSAIDRYLHDLEDPMMCKEALDKLSKMDWLVRRSLYWPDGKRKKLTKSQVSETTRKGTSHLLQALVDKYNDEHNLLDLAYELKDILQCQTICENHIWYEHFNFTTKTKGADGIDSAIENLFFAELTYLKGDELAVSCLCMIDTNANGHCYGCKNNGSVHMKHPNTANAYTAGSLDGYLPFGIEFEWDDPSISVEKDEERLRRIYKGLDDPHVLASIATPSPYATATFIQD